MQLHHYIGMIFVLLIGYYIGAHYKMNLPLIG